MKKKLAAINCLDKSASCDQIKLAALATEYQLKVQELTANYVAQDRSSLCYDLQSSADLSVETGSSVMAIKPSSMLTSNSNDSKQLKKSTPSAAGEPAKSYAMKQCDSTSFPNYHVCDWTEEEWKTSRSCTNAHAQLLRDKACPDGNPDVDEDGPPPRLSFSGYRAPETPYNTFLVSPAYNHTLTIESSGFKGRSGSYCVQKVGSNSCSNQSGFTPIDLSVTRGRFNLAHQDLPPGDYAITLLNNVTGKTTTENFVVVNVEGAFPCFAGKWIENKDMEFGPFAKTGTQPSSDFLGKDCPCARNTEVKDSSNRRWKCIANSAPKDMKIPGVKDSCVGNKGTFCNEAESLVTEWVEHICTGAPTGAGWMKQDDNFYHRLTALTCGTPVKVSSVATTGKAQEAGCSVMNGEFCGGTHMTEWLNNTCGLAPGGSGWMDQGNNIWHRGTTRLCAK